MRDGYLDLCLWGVVLLCGVADERETGEGREERGDDGARWDF
jgi:hypothetical protein